jgi:hypothetical protein
MTEYMQETGYLQSINSDKHLSLYCTGTFFYMTTFCIDFYEIYLSALYSRGKHIAWLSRLICRIPHEYIIVC